MITKKRVINFCIAWLIAGTFNACGSAVYAWHHKHVSGAEVEFNSTLQTFQVAVCVWPEDLQIAVSKFEGRTIDIDAEPDETLNEIMKRYVDRHFKFIGVPSVKEPFGIEGLGTAGGSAIAVEGDANARPAAIRWVGSEIKIKQAWLYFEIDASEADTWNIENRMFFEIHKDQTNQLLLNHEGKWTTMTFSPEQGASKWAR